MSQSSKNSTLKCPYNYVTWIVSLSLLPIMSPHSVIEITINQVVTFLLDIFKYKTTVLSPLNNA